MTDSPDLKAVVFDLDGLLFNTEHLYQDVGIEVLRRRGKVWTKELLDAMMGLPGAIAIQTMIDWHDLDDTVDQLRAESEEIFETLLDDKLTPMPGALELLAALEEAQIPKAIATSSNRDFVRNVLSRFRLEPRFSFILAEEDVQCGKPHPEIYLTAARRFGRPVEQVMVLEDSENGCRAAVQAGTFTVAVPGEYSREHDFAGASLLAESLADRRIYESLGLAAC